MKVKALQTGFFGGSRIREGQEFDVPDGTKGTWFVTVGEHAAQAAKAPKAKPKAQPQTLSELAKEPATGAGDLA